MTIKMAIDLNDLTPEQRKALAAEALETEKEAARKRDDDRKAYKEMVSEKVESVFPVLLSLADSLTDTKRHVYDEFQTALEMKPELYDVADDQNTHNFINKAATKRIVLGACVRDDYDDTVKEGIAKVKKYIESLAKDEESRMLVGAILRLLSRDQKGNLKASRVVQLRQMALDSGDELFLDGVKIIEQAYRPVQSKTFVRAEYKDEMGAWVGVPLGMTEAGAGKEATV